MSEGRAERKKFYATKRWRALRTVVLRDSPFCVWVENEATGRQCMRLATDVDHIIDRAVRPDLEWDRSNLQPLCHPHHSAKTLATMRRRQQS